MNMPGLTAEAALYQSGRSYYRIGNDVIAGAKARVRLAAILSGGTFSGGIFSGGVLSGGCDLNNPNIACRYAWDTCQYYAALTNHSGADVSNCCRYYTSYCQVVTPGGGGSGPGLTGGVGGGNPEGGGGSGMPFKPFTRPT
jgi:hypothetical protein